MLKSFAEFALASAKKWKSFFSGGMYVEEKYRSARKRAKGAPFVRCREPQPFQTRAQ